RFPLRASTCQLHGRFPCAGGSAMFERLLSRLVIRPLLAAGMAATLSLGAAAPAWAQATGGWTLNIVNNGPDPIPAGGELSFAVRIDNNANDDRPPTAITFT